MSLRVACLGAGYFARFHYESWAQLGGVTLVAACDQDLSRAQATDLEAFSDLDTMLDAVRPDLLDIILPPAGHAASVRTAIAHGVRNIICQKPFCLDLAEAQTVTAEAKAAGVTLIVHENIRFQPWYRALKALLEEGALGDVQQLTFRLRPGDGQGPQAYLDRQPYFQQMERFLVHETAVHWVDTFRYLLGNPLAVYADLRQVNPVIAGEDAGYILFDHPGGVRALFDGNRSLDHAADNARRTMGEALIEGTKAVVTLGGDGALWLRKFGSQDAQCVLQPDLSEGFGGNCVHHLQQHVVSALTNGTVLENTAEDYLTVLRIEAAIYASAQTGRKVTL